MTFFSPHAATGKNSPTMTVASPSVGKRRNPSLPKVGAFLLTPAQREAAIRRGLAAANSHEAKARHFRALVAQLKEKSDGQA